VNSNYKIDLGDDEFVKVPESVRYQIIQDHMIRSYHWVIGTGMFLVGFLTGIIAS
jgi:hypothetical protein